MKGSKSVLVAAAIFMNMTQLHASDNGHASNGETLDTHSQLMESEKKRRERQGIEQQKQESIRKQEEARKNEEEKGLAKLEKELTMAGLKKKTRSLEKRVEELEEALKNCKSYSGPNTPEVSPFQQPSAPRSGATPTTPPVGSQSSTDSTSRQP